MDIALIPVWFFSSTRGKSLIEQHLPGRHRIAVHISPEAMAETRERFAGLEPEIVVFGEALQRRRY